jgi:hypothetical protein
MKAPSPRTNVAAVVLKVALIDAQEEVFHLHHDVNEAVYLLLYEER